MREKIKFNMGSSFFFGGMEGYIVKDTDELCIMEGYSDKIKSNVLNMKLDGKDVFFYRDMDKEGFIKDTIDCKVPMRVGKFLIPDFCKYIDFKIEDYERLKDVFDALDDKHRYEIMIRDFYIENKDFILTDEQRKLVYEEYKRERQEKTTE